MHFFKENSLEKNKKYEDFIDDGILNYSDGEYEVIFYWCLNPLEFSGSIKTFNLLDSFQLKGKIESEDIRAWPIDCNDVWQSTIFPPGDFGTVLDTFNTIKEEATIPIGAFLEDFKNFRNLWPAKSFGVCYNGYKKYKGGIIINYALKGPIGRTVYLFDFNFKVGTLTFINLKKG